jgi:putative NIF3 family GTP cyclohydrolase 1 type 2
VADKINTNCGMGVISIPKSNIKTLELVEKVSQICSTPIRYSGNDNTELKKIAIVGGSGTSFIDAVITNKCDCFITADVTYHQFHFAKDNFTLIDVGHYEMEQFVPYGIAKSLNSLLEKNRINFAVSNTLTNPVNYYPKNNFIDNQKNYLEKL